MNDIWDTPQVLKGLLEKFLKDDATVAIESLERPLPEAHAFAGKTPLVVMAACGQQQSTSSFPNKITIIASGSSYHAALFAEYLIETLARVPAEVQYASEFRYRQPLFQSGDVLIIVSSSGETYDCVESLRRIKQSEGAKEVTTVGVVNAEGSTLALECDAVILTTAGSEKGVASTKVFSATSFAFVCLAIALGEARGALPTTEKSTIINYLKELPELVQGMLDREGEYMQYLRPSGGRERSIPIGECTLWDIACQNVLASNFIFLGRGFNFPIALEGAMKLKEIAYIHAEGYPAAEMKHGPIALIDQFMPVVFIAPKADPTYEKIKSNIEEVRARHGSIIAITESDNKDLDGICEHVIRVPPTHECLMPLIAVIPLQLIAFLMGVLRGNEVDNPRSLHKQFTDSGL